MHGSESDDTGKRIRGRDEPVAGDFLMSRECYTFGDAQRKKYNIRETSKNLQQPARPFREFVCRCHQTQNHASRAGKIIEVARVNVDTPGRQFYPQTRRSASEKTRAAP